MPSRSSAGCWLRRRATLHPRTRSLVLLPEGEDVNGKLVRSLSRLRTEPVIVRVEPSEELPDPALYRVAVLVGSRAFSDVAASGQLATELEWIRRAEAVGTAVLGIGHGARALAYAFGGKVEPASEPHRGWTLVASTVPHRIAAGPWLAWQHDRIRLPETAEVLAENRLGPQAFRIGRHLGVQFHPEATPDAVRRWARRAGDDGGAWPSIDVLKPDEAAAEVRSRRLIEGFASSV